MDIELKKIKTPFSPNEQYFVDLASRIQKRVGIEVEEIRQESPKLELNKKKKPLQLTVEFGYPLTAEKNTPEVSDVNTAYAEPISTGPSIQTSELNLQTTDSVLPTDETVLQTPESLLQTPEPVLQTPEPVLQTPESLLQTPEPVLQSPEPVLQTPEPTLQTPQPIIEVIQEVDLASSIEEVELIQNDVLASSIEEVELIQNDVLASSIEEVELIQNNVLASSIEEVELIQNDVLASSVEDTEKVEFMEISETVVSPYFSDADLDRLHEQMHLENAQSQTHDQEITGETQLHTTQVESNISEEKIGVDTIENEVLPTSPTGDFENAFTDAELDLLHDLHSKENERNSHTTEQKTAKVEVVEIHNSLDSAIPSPEKTEKTIKIPSDSRVIDRENQAAKVKPSFMEMIPWSTVFGMVASLMAVASAWFIWNSIQKPVAIDALIDQAVVTTPVEVDNSTNSEVVEEGIQIDELTPSQQVTYELIGNTDESNVLKTEKFDFKKMSEKSKVSSVELEKNGLTVLELEDPIFDEVTL